MRLEPGWARSQYWFRIAYLRKVKGGIWDPAVGENRKKKAIHTKIGRID